MSHPARDHFTAQFVAGLSEILGALDPVGLQFLYWLRARHPTTIPNAVAELVCWKGQRQRPAALLERHEAAALIESLVSQGLLFKMGEPQHLVVTPKTITLLTKLFPGWEDADLPSDFVAWEAAWPASRDAIDRQLRKLFELQDGHGRRYN